MAFYGHKILIIISYHFYGFYDCVRTLIHNQLYEYFDKYKLLAKQQYGIRKQHSTEYVAVKLIDHVSKKMENGKTPTNVYIDLSKAFDMLTFVVLLFKLKYYGVTDTALETRAENWWHFSTQKPPNVGSSIAISEPIIAGLVSARRQPNPMKQPTQTG